MRWLLLAAGAALASASCASATRLHSANGYDRNVISRAEILECDASDALSLVRRLRGEFLTNRGRTSILLPTSSYPAVYVDQNELGPIEYLANIKPSDIAEIRLYRSWEAATKFGPHFTAGVIQVITYVPRPEEMEGDSSRATRHRPLPGWPR